MSDIMGLWVILRVEIVHGRQCTMSMEFVQSFMRRCWKNSMDNVHSTLDIVPGFHGHCPHIPWVPWTLSTHSMESVDNVHAFCGKYPWIPWKMSRMSMESMDFLQTGFILVLGGLQFLIISMCFAWRPVMSISKSYVLTACARVN